MKKSNSSSSRPKSHKYPEAAQLLADYIDLNEAERVQARRS